MSTVQRIESSHVLQITARLGACYDRVGPELVDPSQNPNYSNYFVCKICEKLAKPTSPLECRKCRAIFCGSCVSKRPVEERHCPSGCRAGFAYMHRVLKEQLGALLVRCVNQECTVVTEHRLLFRHFKICDYSLCYCVFWPECDVLVTKRDLSEHIDNECRIRRTRCKGCNLLVDKLAGQHHCSTLLIIPEGKEQFITPELRAEAPLDDY